MLIVLQIFIIISLAVVFCFGVWLFLVDGLGSSYKRAAEEAAKKHNQEKMAAQAQLIREKESEKQRQRQTEEKLAELNVLQVLAENEVLRIMIEGSFPDKM